MYLDLTLPAHRQDESSHQSPSCITENIIVNAQSLIEYNRAGGGSPSPAVMMDIIAKPPVILSTHSNSLSLSLFYPITTTEQTFDSCHLSRL